MTEPMQMGAPAVEQSAARASRAIGSMFFAVFGGAWMSLWCLNAFGVNKPVLVLVLVVTTVLYVFAFRQFRTNRSSRSAEAKTPERKRADQAFYLINALQWALIAVVASELTKYHLQDWVIPSIIFIVGAHFMPLAMVFKVRRHYVTGAALMLLAVIYPLASPSGPAAPIGCLGAGIILWISAAVSLVPPKPGTAIPANE